MAGQYSVNVLVYCPGSLSLDLPLSTRAACAQIETHVLLCHSLDSSCQWLRLNEVWCHAVSLHSSNCVKIYCKVYFSACALEMCKSNASVIFPSQIQLIYLKETPIFNFRLWLIFKSGKMIQITKIQLKLKGFSVRRVRL